MTMLSLARPAEIDLQGEALRRVEAYLRHEQERRQLQGAAGRVEGVVEFGGGEFGYAYDAAGDLVEVCEANGLRRRYRYDARRRLVAVEHGDGQTTRYRYDEQDRLESCDDRGSVTRYRYDAAGRVVDIRHGQGDRQGDVSVYRYDEGGGDCRQSRVVLARTSQVTTSWCYDAAGRTQTIEQALGGVTLQVGLQYDEDGRLAAMTLPGSDQVLRYTWDERGRPHTVAIEGNVLAHFAYDDAGRKTTVEHGNGVTAQSVAGAIDGRLVQLEVCRGAEPLLVRSITYGAAGQIIADGEQRYEYDGLGRLVAAKPCQQKRAADGTDCVPAQQVYDYAYDVMDNLVAHGGPDGSLRFACDEGGRLDFATNGSGAKINFTHDRWGRLLRKTGPGGDWEYRYDDGGRLLEVRRAQATVATFLYDHKGRLAYADVAGTVERYLYGDADELLAVTDATGRPLRLLVRTPLGVHAQVQGALGVGEVLFRHGDERGTLRLVTDMAGAIRARFAYECFGQPLPADVENVRFNKPVFHGPMLHGSVLVCSHRSLLLWRSLV